MPTPHKVRINPADLDPARDLMLPPGPCSACLAHLADMTTANTARDTAGNTALLEPAVSLKELAAELQVTCQTLYDLRSQGRGPRGFRVGRELRFRRSEIQTWLAQHAVRDQPLEQCPVLPADQPSDLSGWPRFDR